VSRRSNSYFDQLVEAGVDPLDAGRLDVERELVAEAVEQQDQLARDRRAGTQTR
jgi:hypothetical protein